MILHVLPTDTLSGAIQLPPSKSYSIRAFLIAACGGRSQIIHPSLCDDAKVALRIARCLGSRVRFQGKGLWEISALISHQRSRIFDVGESGTVLRFLLPLLALRPGQYVIKGRGTLKGRPNRHLVEALRRQGVQIQGRGTLESVPLQMAGGTLRGGRILIDGTLSSQFISALLLAVPQLPQDTRLLIQGDKIVSETYIEMTLQLLKRSGIQIDQRTRRSFCIPGRQTFKGLKRFLVPADHGLAAFHLAAAVLIKSDVQLCGFLGPELVQADGEIFTFLERMGVRMDRTAIGIRIQGPVQLKGGRFSLKNCPDLVPIMAVLSLFAKGKTVLVDIAHARAKESNRISDLRQELLKIGARIEETAAGLIIFPQPHYQGGVLLDPRHDHRLAMAFSVLGLRVGVRVKDIACVAKSYPDFVKDFQKLGARVLKRK